MRVGVLGCGYVGLEVCRQLADRGHTLSGIRRTAEGLDAIENAGGRAIQADVTDPATLAAVPDVDALVFAASTGGRGADAARRIYVQGLRDSIEHFAGRDDPPDRLVYTSSTGVYGDHDGDWVDEETAIEPTTEKTRVLARAEGVALSEATARGIDGTVARFAGLYGPDRYRLERYLEGPVTQGYLNMVHRDDAAGAIRHLLLTDRARGEVVLVVDDEPVEKWTFADWLADECGVSRPEKRTVAERLEAGDLSAAARRRLQTSKRCDNGRLRGLDYEFSYPTYRDGYRDAIEQFRSGG
jgi:nucleoside-diphosphate-sugar epimerase